ncbi:gamma-glutamylcyclotransferase family protein [Butyricicoccus sp.]|uniref:gamma-glutamylcyclotransferase family protein n=1 Tax=Butyricicoccus sp. TaxID=2049021 RepID=UPI003F177080
MRQARKPYRYYAAYGSNLSVEQMAHRCPDARMIGVAVLNGWKLQFKQFATIEPDAAYSTPVLVWEISERDERNLDVYEGYPTLYYKQKVPIKVFRMDSGEPMLVEAMVYIMNDGHILEAPSRYYYNVLAAGYKAFHFPMYILERVLAESLEK